MARTNRPSHLPAGWDHVSGTNRAGDTLYRHAATGWLVRRQGHQLVGWGVLTPAGEPSAAGGMHAYLKDALAAAEAAARQEVRQETRQESPT